MAPSFIEVFQKQIELEESETVHKIKKKKPSTPAVISGEFFGTKKKVEPIVTRQRSKRLQDKKQIDK